MAIDCISSIPNLLPYYSQTQIRSTELQFKFILYFQAFIVIYFVHVFNLLNYAQLQNYSIVNILELFEQAHGLNLSSQNSIFSLQQKPDRKQTFKQSSMNIQHSPPLHHTPSISFIPPSQILSGLLQAPDPKNTSNQECNCECHYENNNQQQQRKIKLQNNQQSIEHVQIAIQNLHQTLDAMNSEVVQVQGLLSQRDVLYHQLDHLRAEREKIQEDMESYEVSVKKTKVKVNRGLKQLNQRLRRRITQVRDYIDKMDSQNTKIEQSMSINNQTIYSHHHHPQNQSLYNYTQYRGPRSPSWLNRVTMDQNQQSYGKFNRQYFDGLRKRLQVKQQQAWERVRRQQQEIQNRNARSLMNFNRAGMRVGGGYLSPKYHRVY